MNQQPQPQAPQPQAPTAPSLAAAKNTTINVLSCASVQGRRGPQWDVSADVPILSQYPTHFYLDQDEYPAGIQLGQYQVVISRGNLRRGKDGTHDWDYYWNIQDWAADPAQATPAQSQQPAPAPRQGPQPTAMPTHQGQGADPTQHSIRQSVTLAEAMHFTRKEMDITVNAEAIDWLQRLETNAESIWRIYQNIGSETTAPLGGGTSPSSGGADDDEQDVPWA